MTIDIEKLLFVFLLYVGGAATSNTTSSPRLNLGYVTVM